MKLGEVLKDWRWANKLGLREAAKLIGIPYVTLMRLEHGYSPEGKTLAMVLNWLLK